MPISEPVFPAHLVVAEKRCLVAGGGRIASRKVRELVDAGAIVTVVAPVICEEIELLPVAKVRRGYQNDDLSDKWLAIAATDDPAVNAQVYRDGECQRIWVNSVDDPAHCSYITPAIARQGPITVSISTGGRSPALASWLRKRVETELGPEYLVLLDRLERKRESMHQQNLSTETIDWDSFINESLAQ